MPVDPGTAYVDPTTLIDDVNSLIVQVLSAHDPAELHAAAACAGVNVGETYTGRLWTGGVCPLVRLDRTIPDGRARPRARRDGASTPRPARPRDRGPGRGAREEAQADGGGQEHGEAP